MGVSADDKLRDLLTDFDAAMLVTRTPAGELRSRPMAVAKIEPGGCMWFLTERHSGKIEEIARDDHVNVAMQSERKFVSISGRAAAVDDSRKVAELWNESWRVWFPGGKDDPTLTLLKVQGETGEYWDNSGASGIKYLIEAGKAYLSGEKPRQVESDPQVHGKVML
jgi:general stress protein 26